MNFLHTIIFCNLEENTRFGQNEEGCVQLSGDRSVPHNHMSKMQLIKIHFIFLKHVVFPSLSSVGPELSFRQRIFS